MITSTEAAELIHCTPRHVRRLARRGELTAVGTELRDSRGRPGLLFVEAEVIEYELTHRKDSRIATLAARWRECA